MTPESSIKIALGGVEMIGISSTGVTEITIVCTADEGAKPSVTVYLKLSVGSSLPE